MTGIRAGPGMFPLPAPPSPFTPESRSRRVRQRHNRAVVRHKLVIKTVEAVNYLSTSCSSEFSSSFVNPSRNFKSSLCSSESSSSSENPSSNFRSSLCQSSQSSQARNQPVATSQQQRALGFITESAARFVSRLGSPESSCGDDWAWSDILPANANLNLSGASRAVGAVPLIASRVALPAGTQTVPLLDLLPPHLREMYSCPERLLNPDSDPRPSPRAKHFGSAAEYAALVRRMSLLNMVDFTRTPKVVNGVFGVPKDGDSIRLIVDARPANRVFIPSPKVELPTPDLLTELAVDPSRPLYVAKVDLDNFYHRLVLPAWLRPYFALPPVRAGDVSPELANQYGLSTLVYPCCTRLPMGWSHSVYLAQQAHEHFLSTCTSLLPADRLTASSDRFVNRARHAVYIDDLNLLGHDRLRLEQLQDEYIAAVQTRGLVVKWTKVVCPSLSGVEVIGVAIDGRAHTFGLSVPKLRKLQVDTAVLLRRGSCTGLELQRLVGRWTWAMLARRPALSTFNAVYRFCQVAGARLFTVWPTVRRELQVAVRLAPLLWCSLRHDWFPDAVATDASMEGLGVVALATQAEDLADAAAEPVHVPEPGVFPALHPSLRPVLASRSRVIVSSRWRDHEHINVLELRAVSTALRWIASRPAGVDCRVMLLVDSSVCVFSLNKGRSSSRPMLRRLRGISALVLACGLRVFTRWVPSACNPADRPSRNFNRRHGVLR